MRDLSANKLAELIGRRRKCLTQLRDLGRKQQQLVGEGNIVDLLRLFPAKQQLIVALESIEKELAPFHEQDPQSRSWTSAEARARWRLDAEECRQLIQEVMELEQDGERQLTTRRDEVAGQLRALAAASRAHQAYRSHANMDSVR